MLYVVPFEGVKVRGTLEGLCAIKSLTIEPMVVSISTSLGLQPSSTGIRSFPESREQMRKNRVKPRLTEEILVERSVRDGPFRMTPDSHHHGVLPNDDWNSSLGDVEAGVYRTHVECVPGPRIGHGRNVNGCRIAKIADKIVEGLFIESIGRVENGVPSGQATVMFDDTVGIVKHIEVEELNVANLSLIWEPRYGATTARKSRMACH